MSFILYVLVVKIMSEITIDGEVLQFIEKYTSVSLRKIVHLLQIKFKKFLCEFNKSIKQMSVKKINHFPLNFTILRFQHPHALTQRIAKLLVKR